MDPRDFRLEVLPLGRSVGLYLQVPAVERAPCRSVNPKSNFEPGRCKQRKVRNRVSKSILNVTGSHCGDMSTGLMCVCVSQCRAVQPNIFPAGDSGMLWGETANARISNL